MHCDVEVISLAKREEEKAHDDIEDRVEKADFFKDEILKDMTDLRASCDKLETETAAEYWPFPTYGDLLFAVR